MTALEAIKEICLLIPGYSFVFEDNEMMNITADDNPFPCIFFEEYTQGYYAKEKYFRTKMTRVQLYFMKLCDFENNASEREKLRNEIESEAVYPFIDLFESKYPNTVSRWQFYTPFARFDANEVSIMLQFDFKQSIC